MFTASWKLLVVGPQGILEKIEKVTYLYSKIVVILPQASFA